MDINPYQSPGGIGHPIVDRTAPPSGQAVFQRLAAALLLGGVLWGLFCAYFVLMDPLLGLVIFGPGYAVTVGYFCRACLPCSIGWRKVIWIASLVVQGACLSIACLGGQLGTIAGIWWLFSTMISLAGVIGDGPEHGSSREVRI